MNIARRFILDNSLAAISAVPLSDSTVATDGLTSCIRRFSVGCQAFESIQTLRPFLRLRENIVDSGYTAVSGCNARVYFLDDDFCETGFVDLDVTGCGCSCRCESEFSELTDVSVACIGSESFIVASFKKSAYLFDRSGRRLTRLCETERCERLTDFIHPDSELFAMSVVTECARTVTVSDGGNIQTAILDSAYSLRQLIAMENREIWGLFGLGYIYNQIIPIYQNGVLLLPTGRKQ